MWDRIENALIIAFLIYFTISHYCDFKRTLGLPTTHCTVTCSNGGD